LQYNLQTERQNIDEKKEKNSNFKSHKTIFICFIILQEFPPKHQIMNNNHRFEVFVKGYRSNNIWIPEKLISFARKCTDIVTIICRISSYLWNYEVCMKLSYHFNCFAGARCPSSSSQPLLCVLKALITHTHLHICTHTHVTRICKSHDVLNETPDTYFIVSYGVSKTHRTDHSFDTRSRLYRRVNDEGVINIIDLERIAQKKQRACNFQIEIDAILSLMFIAPSASIRTE